MVLEFYRGAQAAVGKTKALYVTYQPFRVQSYNVLDVTLAFLVDEMLQDPHIRCCKTKQYREHARESTDG